MDHWSYRTEGGRHRSLVENQARQYRRYDGLQLDSRKDFPEEGDNSSCMRP